MNKVLQRRIFAEPIQVRKNADGTIGVRGYAAVFDSEAHGEVIRAGAFNRTLAQRDDIRLLVNHDGVPLARTKSGTLLMGVDEHGEWFDAPSLDPANPRVQELVSAMERGDIDQCSFAGYFDSRSSNGITEVLEVRQVDVSIVTYPWYEETVASLTGDRDLDRSLVSLRSAGSDLSLDQRVNAYKALRTAPPGKVAFDDIGEALIGAVWSKINAATGTDPWLWLEDFGEDWLVYCIYDIANGSCTCWQASWSQAADGSFEIGDPIEVEEISEWRPVTAADAAPPAEPMRSLSIAEARALFAPASAA